MKVVISWTKDTPNVFLCAVEHNGVEYSVCVELDGRWIYTINSEFLDMPVCSIGSYDTKEQAQSAALKHLEREK
jgi:hypothetical protein